MVRQSGGHGRSAEEPAAVRVRGGSYPKAAVALLDLSEGGARLEHAGRFTLNAICFLRLPAPEGELVLKARVIHSTVSRKVPVPAGEPTLLFHSGVEFVGLTSDALLALRQLVARLREGPPPA